MRVAIITYNALQKRKVFLDSIAQGLDEFGILSVIQIFPDLFSGLFISSTKIVANDVLEIIRYPAKKKEWLCVFSRNVCSNLVNMVSL